MNFELDGFVQEGYNKGKMVLHYRILEIRILQMIPYAHMYNYSANIKCGLFRGFLEFNPLNPELNPICYLLALLGAHHFLHVSRIRVKLLTFRLLMSYIYIYIWSTHS